MMRGGMVEGNGIDDVARVMVGTDRSETAERAVRWAAALAERYAAELHVVQVVVPLHPADTEHGAAEITRARAAADELQVYTTQLAGERGKAHVVIDDDPALAIVNATEEHGIDVLVVGNAGMAGRKEFLLGNVPNRISHNAQVHGDHREHDERRGGRDRRAGAGLAPWKRDGDRDGAASDLARGQDRDGLRQARPEGAVRPARRRGSRRPPPPGEAPPIIARGPRAHVLEARSDPVDEAGPRPARVHRGARDPAGQRAPAHGGAGRARHGAGARGPVGGRVRDDRGATARRRNDRAGPSRHARRPHEDRDQGAAAGGARADRAGPGAARGLRREGGRSSRAPPGRRHAGGVRAPVRVPPPGARLPPGGGEHRADAGRDRRVLAPARPERLCRRTPRPGCS